MQKQSLVTTILETIASLAVALAAIIVGYGALQFVQSQQQPVVPLGLGTTHLSGNLTLGGNLTAGGLVSGSNLLTNTMDIGMSVGQGGMTVDDSGNLVAASATITGATALNGGLTMDTSAFTVANTSGNVSTAGTLAVAGNTTLSGFVIAAAASITPTNGGAITPTASTIILTPAAAVTPTLAACSANGTQLTLYNSVNAAIVLQDSGNLIATGALTLGQYDSLQLVCISTKWVEIATSAN
jgi:hypothetical protein